MAKISMKALLESGVHFGHRTHRWNPEMRPYIFTERNGIHIIDLQQTVQALDDAYKLIRDKVAEGGTILFVGTKRQAVETIEEEALRCGMPYVTVRWLGGMLTNWSTMRQRIMELDRLERMREKGEFERLTKKEGLMLGRKIDKLTDRFGGIRALHRLPDMLFVIDVRREETAVTEANKLGIPVVALVDTNCDPNDIDYVIPSNDDAIRAIKLLVAHIADAVLEGKAMRKDEEEEMPAKAMPAATAEEQMIDEEVDDAELLGESTLAKMEAAAEEEAEAVTDEAEEAVEAEAADDSEENGEEEAEEMDDADDDDDDDDDDDGDDDDADDDDEDEE